MIRRILQDISNYPIVPTRTEETFYEDMEAWVTHGANVTIGQQNQLRNEINNTVDDINGVLDSISNNSNQIANDKTIVNQAKLEAQSARDSAIAANNAAQTIYDTFDDRYLGTKTTAPTVDNDGNALQTGALYFNSTSGKLFIYDLVGNKWVDITTIPTLLSSLSDVAFTTKANNDVLQYDSATGKWVNRSFYSKAELDVFIANKIPKITNPATNALPKINPDGTLSNSSIFTDSSGALNIITQFENGRVNLGIISNYIYGDNSGNIIVGSQNVDRIKLNTLGFILGNDNIGQKCLSIDNESGIIQAYQSNTTMNIPIKLNPQFSGGNILIGTLVDDGLHRLQVNGAIKASSGSKIGSVNHSVFVFNDGNSRAANAIHFKTNIRTSTVNKMLCFRVTGYNYGSSESINAVVSGYIYSADSIIINSSTTDNRVTLYKTSDGYLALKIQLSSNINYSNFVVDSIETFHGFIESSNLTAIVASSTNI